MPIKNNFLQLSLHIRIRKINMLLKSSIKNQHQNLIIKKSCRILSKRKRVSQSKK